jgi:hypothetical protein
LRCLILIALKQKKLFNHYLPPKILLQHHLTPKKPRLSIIYYQEIYEIS